MFAAQDIRAGGRQSDSDYQYTLSSTDLDLLQKWAPIVGQAHGDGRGHHRCLQRPRSRRLAAQSLLIDRQERLEPRRARPGHRQRVEQRVLAAADLDTSTPSATSTWWCWRSTRNSRAIRPTSTQSSSPAQTTSRCRFRRSFVTSADCRHWRCFIRSRFPSTTVSFNLLPDVPLEVATTNIQRAVDELHMPEGIRGSFDGNAGDLAKNPARHNAAADPGRAGGDVYRARACSMRAWRIP